MGMVSALPTLALNAGVGGAGGDQLVCGHTAFSYLSAVIAYGVHDSVGSINQQLFRVELLLRSATDDCISQDVH